MKSGISKDSCLCWIIIDLWIM